MTGPSQDNVFWSEAIYGAITGQPMVKLSFAGRSTIVDTDSARRIAKDIIDTAHAADGDAFVVEFFQEECGFDQAVAVQMLGKFRDWRIKRSER